MLEKGSTGVEVVRKQSSREGRRESIFFRARAALNWHWRQHHCTLELPQVAVVLSPHSWHHQGFKQPEDKLCPVWLHADLKSLWPHISDPGLKEEQDPLNS